MNSHRYSDEELQGLYRAIYERRDMRHFLPDPVDPDVLLRLMEAAHRAPSVGFMQPWRLLRITDTSLRKKIHQHVEEERLLTARALGKREDEFMKLKVEGIMACGELLVVGLVDKRDKFVFGRRTMPEMDLASASCAIQNLWLVARAEGIGVGWVSLFDPEYIRRICKMPEGSQPIAVLCIGHVKEFYDMPMLEAERWDTRRPMADILYENCWGHQAEFDKLGIDRD